MLGGILSDRFGHRNTVILGYIGTGVAISILGMAHQFEQIVIAAACMGLLFRLNKPAITALVAEISRQKSAKAPTTSIYWQTIWVQWLQCRGWYPCHHELQPAFCG